MKTWSVAEANQVLTVAREAGLLLYGFFKLALETGLRKGELLGLRWEDVGWKAGALSVRRTLVRGGSRPVFGPVKNAKNGESGRRVSLPPGRRGPTRPSQAPGRGEVASR